MKRRIVILYNDRKYEFMNCSHIKPQILTRTSIETIFIPLAEHQNLYFPMKWSDISAYRRVDLSIHHRIFSYDYDEGIGDDISVAEFHTSCFDIVELGNALFNLYKFRGASISIVESTVGGITSSFTSYPTKIQMNLFDDSGKPIHRIDSGEMESMENICGKFADISIKSNGSTFAQPQFASDDRMDSLENYIYTPAEFEDLPEYFSLKDQKHWAGIDVYTDVSENDYIMVKISDFGCYYCIDANTFNYISQPNNLKNFIIYPFCCPVSSMELEKMGAALKRSFIGKHKPSRSDKERWRIAVGTGQFFNPLELELVADSGNSFLMYYSLFRVITNYLEYFITASYGSFEECDTLCFSMFGNNQRILSKDEYLDDRLTDVFLQMIDTNRL